MSNFKGYLVCSFEPNAPHEHAALVQYFDHFPQAAEVAQLLAEEDGHVQVAIYQLVEVVQNAPCSAAKVE